MRVWKAILVPSGLQVGYSFEPASFVSRRLRVPSGRMVQMSRPPSRAEKNAIDRPSGDHAGDQSAIPGLLVRLRGFPPLAGTTMMSPSSPRGGLSRYAISFPSGDQAG